MICLSLNEKTYEDCLSVVKKSEFSEIRLDLIPELTDEQYKVLFSYNTIATCRPVDGVSEDRRIEKLIRAINSGADYVDIEIEAHEDTRFYLIETARKNNCKVIISYHNYKETPSEEELKGLVAISFKEGADIAKIATMVNKKSDNARLLSLYDSDKEIVSIGMGAMGKISRMAAVMLGAPFTFAAKSRENVTAPGQFTVKELDDLFNRV